jgi:acyl-CoA reductase-like NAD-dependent aldehyde dehydrogenase
MTGHVSPSRLVPAAPTLSLIGRCWRESETTFPVKDKYTGDIVSEVSQATRLQVAEAVAAAAVAFESQTVFAVEMALILRRIRDLLEQKRACFTDVLIAKTGFVACSRAILRAESMQRSSCDSAPSTSTRHRALVSMSCRSADLRIVASAMKVPHMQCGK